MTLEELEKIASDRLTVLGLASVTRRLLGEISVDRIVKEDDELNRLIFRAGQLVSSAANSEYETTLGRLAGSALDLCAGALLAALLGFRDLANDPRASEKVVESIRLSRYYLGVLERIDKHIYESSIKPCREKSMGLFSFVGGDGIWRTKNRAYPYD